jgi:hypothetical protein
LPWGLEHRQYDGGCETIGVALAPLHEVELLRMLEVGEDGSHAAVAVTRGVEVELGTARTMTGNDPLSVATGLSFIALGV